ncbi:HNH endonuclease [Actinacidiphila sp. bgisy160]|uniref:HNH endonuclease n=1 Tax=Actinacidiphila sp. bgisy160 TaxID=3413796 RepID=UPI003D72EEE5
MKRHAHRPGGIDTICRAHHVAAGRARCAANPGAHAADSRAHRARLAARTDAEIAAGRARLRPDGLKRCRKCREQLPLDAFSDNRTRADGLNVDCRDCDNPKLRRAAMPHIEAMDLWTCVYCGGPAEHTDHVIPQAHGGSDDAVNLVPACAECNTSKNAAPVLEWIARRDPELLDLVAGWPVEVIEVTA